MNFAWMDASKMVQGGLAVVGAAVVGALCSGFATKFLARTVAAKPAPLLLLRTARGGGGLAAGFLASMFFFGGPGGWGAGGAGTGDGGDKPTTPNATLVKDTKIKPAAASWLRVVMLGGDRVRGDAFYQLDGETAARTLSSVKDHVNELRGKQQIPAGIEVIVRPDSVARDHPAVKDLESWATEVGLRVDINIAGGDPRP